MRSHLGKGKKQKQKSRMLILNHHRAHTTLTFDSIPNEILTIILKYVWNIVKFGPHNNRYSCNKVSRRWNQIYSRIFWAENVFTWRKELSKQLALFSKVAAESTRVDDAGRRLPPLYKQPIEHRYGE